MSLNDKMQSFMTYFHKQTHYTIVYWKYNVEAMYVNMEIWDEFHKAGIVASLTEEYLKEENYEKIKNYLVKYMQQEEIKIYGGIR
jgi:hypothetical protein